MRNKAPVVPSRPHGPVAESADAADLKSASADPKHLKKQVLTTTGEGIPAVEPATAADTGPLDPHLAQLIESWPRLPEAIRAGIVAMVESVKASGKGRP